MGVAGGVFSVQITFLDGSTVTISGVTMLKDRDKVLRLYRERSSFRVDYEHLGSYPFESIRSWKVID